MLERNATVPLEKRIEFRIGINVGDTGRLASQAARLGQDDATCAFSGRVLLGEPNIAITHFARAARLNPLGPYLIHSQMGTGLAHFLAGRYVEARLWARKALEHRPDFLNALRLLAASSALGGRTEEAEKTVQQLLRLNRTLRISDLKDVYPFHRPEDLANLIEGLRTAGMPD